MHELDTLRDKILLEIERYESWILNGDVKAEIDYRIKVAQRKTLKEVLLMMNEIAQFDGD